MRRDAAALRRASRLVAFGGGGDGGGDGRGDDGRGGDGGGDKFVGVGRGGVSEARRAMEARPTWEARLAALAAVLAPAAAILSGDFLCTEWNPIDARQKRMKM